MTDSRTLTAIAALTLAFPYTAAADTTEVRWQDRVVLEKQGTFCADDPNCFNRYHPSIPPVATAAEGAYIEFHTRDALDSDLTLDSNADDVAALDLSGVHPMSGPVEIEGARRGDVVAVTIIDIEPDEFGYTVIVPGFGFLRDEFTEPYFVGWRQDRVAATSDAMPGIAVPYEAFTGSIGTMPGAEEIEAWKAREAALAAVGGIALPPEPNGALPADLCGPGGTAAEDCLRTVPPRENGGNMDVQQMQVGTTILIPCFVDGCNLFVGDVHYAQGDGEVSGTAIETGAIVTVTTEIRPGLGSVVTAPQVEGGNQIKNMEPSSFHQTIGMPLKEAGEIPTYHTYLDSAPIEGLENLSEDLTIAARHALVQMIEHIQRVHGLNREQAYILASVAVDLRVGQVVDVPNYVMTAVLNKDVFVEE
ncbi:MAG: acetamidase/formamidase family protein [Pseudomonadota bacterium]